MAPKIGSHALAIFIWLTVASPPFEPVAAYRHCPTGWYEWYADCIYLNKQLLNWTEADATCQKLAPGARLGIGRHMRDMPVFEVTNPNRAWVGFIHLSNVWRMVDGGFTASPWGVSGVGNGLGATYCAGFDTKTKTYNYNNCGDLLPSYCRFVIYPGDGDAYGPDRQNIFLPLNRLYGSRDISRESTTRKSVLQIRNTVMSNVITVPGPTGKPNTAVKFLPGLDSRVSFDDPNNQYSAFLRPLGNMYWLFYIFPIQGKPGMIFTYLAPSGDKKGVNFWYDGATSLIMDMRTSGGVTSGYWRNATNCIVPGRWQRILVWYDQSWIYVRNGYGSWCYSAAISVSSSTFYPPTAGMMFGQDPSTGQVWDGSLSGVLICSEFWGYWEAHQHDFEMAINASSLEHFMDEDVLNRASEPYPLPYNLIGFWPLTDYYGYHEGSGKLYESDLPQPVQVYEAWFHLNNPWLARKVFNGGRDRAFLIGANRDYAGLSVYGKPFTFVMHVHGSQSGHMNEDTNGPLLEYRNINQPAIGLSVWLVNGTVMVVATASPANENSTFTASFPNCRPHQVDPVMKSTYRLVVQYDFFYGNLVAMANEKVCGNLSVGQFFFDSFQGFRIGFSRLGSPHQLGNYTGSQPTVYMSGQLFCVFLYDAVLSRQEMSLLTRQCGEVSIQTKTYSGVNQLIYKANNLRVFYPLGRDLGGQDLSGRGHHGDCYKMTASVGPTGLPYSASKFQGSYDSSDPVTMVASRKEFAYTLGTNMSITYAFYVYIGSYVNGDYPAYTAIFSHVATYDEGTETNSYTGMYMVAANLMRMQYAKRSVSWWYVDLYAPAGTDFLNKWLWIVTKYDRMNNTLYLSINGQETMLTVAPLPITAYTYLALGTGFDFWAMRGGKMSCFAMYDYAVPKDEFYKLQEMCNKTLGYYYGKYAKIFTYRHALAGFWPLTKRYLGYDVSGELLHLSMADRTASSTAIRWTTGPSGLENTAANLGGPSRASFQIHYSYTNSNYQKLTNNFAQEFGGLAGGRSAPGQTISFYVYYTYQSMKTAIMYTSVAEPLRYRFAFRYNVFYVKIIAPVSGWSNPIDTTCSVPSKYQSGTWIFISVVTKAVSTPNYRMNTVVYFDGEAICDITSGGSSNINWAYPALFNGFHLGEDIYAPESIANFSLSCFTIFNDVMTDVLAIKSDCDRIVAGEFDELLNAHVQPTALFPLSAQTEGDNVVNAPHGYFMDVDFTQPNANGLPNASMTFSGIPSQYFLADQSVHPYLNTRLRTWGTSILYDAWHNPTIDMTSGAMIHFGYTDSYGPMNGYIKAGSQPLAYQSFSSYRGSRQSGSIRSFNFDLNQWHSFGFHYEPYSDSLTMSMDGFLQDPHMEHWWVRDGGTGGTLTLGFNPTTPVGWETSKFPLVGSLSCVQIYERGLTELETKYARKWCGNPDYLGCYPFDKLKTDVTVAMGDRAAMTGQRCRRLCGDFGKRFSAVDRSYRCLCFDSLPHQAVHHSHAQCPKPIAKNSFEQGGADNGFVSLYTSSLTRKITNFYISRAIRVGCPLGWAHIPGLWTYCYKLHSSNGNYHVMNLNCRSIVNGGFSSEITFPDDDTEDKAVDIFRNSGVVFWMGCTGLRWRNPNCDRADGKDIIGYYPVERIENFGAVLNSPTKEDGLTNGNARDSGYWNHMRVVCKAPVPQLDWCPRRTHRIGNGCYRFIDQPRPFKDAEEYCQRNYTGGRLVTIQNFVHMRRLLNLTDHQSPFWIGLNFTSPSNFSWSNPRMPSNFTYWALDFDPKAVDMSASCVYADSRSGYQWRASNCDRKYRFICEFPPNLSERMIRTGTGGVVSEQITSSVANSNPHLAQYDDTDTTACWCGGNNTAPSEYIQIDYVQPVKVDFVRLFPCLSPASWIRTYQIQHSMNGVNWTLYTYTNGTFTSGTNSSVYIFGNDDSSIPTFSTAASTTSSATFDLNPPIYARYIRIIPTNFSNSKCLRYRVRATLIDPNQPDVRANTFGPIYMDTFRDTGMGVYYRLYVYRLGFSPLPQLVGPPKIIRTNDFVYEPRVIGAQKLILAAANADGPEKETSLILQLETRTRSLILSSCPPDSAAGEMVMCFVRAIGGSNFTVTTSYGSGEYLRTYDTNIIATRHQYGLLDAKENSTGESVWLSTNSTHYQNRIFLMVNFPFEKHTTVQAIEANMREGGRIWVQFWKPFCSAGSYFCIRSYKCLPTGQKCAFEHEFDSYRCPENYAKCEDRSGCCSATETPEWWPPSRNYFTSAQAPLSYQFVREYEIWMPGVGQNIYYFDPDQIQEFEPGTIMAYRYKTATLQNGHVFVRKTNVNTYSFAESLCCSSVIAPASTEVRDFHPMLRAITVDSSTIGMNILWNGGCGAVPFKATLVDSMWPENVMSVSQNIFIISVCAAIDIKVPSVLYAQVRYDLEFTRKSDCFCNYEIAWSDGDDQLRTFDWEAGIKTKLLPKIFREAGTYQARLRVWNPRNDTTLTFVFKVINFIGSIEIQTPNQPAIPFGYDQAFNLISFGGVVSDFSTVNLTVAFNDIHQNAVVSPAADVISGGRCPTPWSITPSGMCLLYVNQLLTFGEAEFYCSSMGSSLAYASSTSQLTWSNITTVGSNASILWVGVTRKRSQNGFWVPVNNDAATVASVDQLTGIPMGSDCAYIETTTMALKAQSCLNQAPFVCQQTIPNYKFCGADGEGWVPYGSSCYKAFPSSPTTFNGASELCRSLGAVLAAPKSNSAVSFLTSVLNSTVSSSASFYLGVWRGSGQGLSSDGRGNIYRPSNPSGSNSCLKLDSLNGEITDTPCSALLPALCERSFAPEAKPSRYFNKLANRRLIRENGTRLVICPLGWSFFKGDCLKVISTTKTLQEASVDCHDVYKAKLVVITDSELNLEVASLLADASLNSSWIGLINGYTANQWLWLDGSGSPSSYSNWDAAGSATLADPAVSGVQLGVDGKWSVQDSSLTLAYVCQRKPGFYAYGRRYAGRCPGNGLRELNGTCFTTPSNANKKTFADAAKDCLALYGGTVAAPLTSEEWDHARLLTLSSSMAFNRDNSGIWLGYVISGSVLTLPSGLSGNPPPSDKTPFYSWAPGYTADLSAGGCLALFPEGGLKIVSCSSTLAFYCQAPAAQCPAGWSVWGGSCVKSSELAQPSTGLGSFDVATTFCQSLLNAYPLSISYASELNVVRTLVSSGAVALGQHVVAGQTWRDAAGRLIYNPGAPSTSQSARVYLDAADAWQTSANTSAPVAMQAICQRPSTLTPDDCALACMSSEDPSPCQTFEYRGDSCMLYPDTIHKYTYGLRSSNGASDLYLADNNVQKHCYSNVLARFANFTKFEGNDSAPHEVIFGLDQHGYYPEDITSMLEITFPHVISLYGFVLATKDATLGFVQTLRFECSAGLMDPLTPCFPDQSLEFSGLNPDTTKEVRYFPNLLTVRRIRVVPTLWNVWPTYQLEYLGCDAVLGTMRVQKPIPYRDVGTYQIRLLDSKSTVLSTTVSTVQKPIGGLGLTLPVAFTYGKNATIFVSYAEGSDTTINASYVGKYVETFVNQSGRTADVFVPSNIVGTGADDDGYSKIRVDLDNAISDPLIQTESVFVEIGIDSVFLKSNQTEEYGTLRGDPVQFFVMTSDCSRCQLVIVFHHSEGTTNETRFYDKYKGGQWLSDFFFTWNLIGQYPVEVFMYNNVSFASAKISVGVENPAKNFYFSLTNPNSIPAHSQGTVQMTFSYDGPVIEYPKWPSHPEYKLTMWNGHEFTGSFETTVPSSGHFSVNLTTIPFSWGHHGTYPVYVVITNNVTVYNYTATYYATFVQSLTGLALSNIDSRFIPTNSWANVSVSLDWGVPWSYRINGSSQDKDWEHMGNVTEFDTWLYFDTPGLYRPALYGRNDVSQSNPVPIDIPIRVENPLEEYSFAVSCIPKYGRLIPSYEGGPFSTEQMNITLWHNTSLPLPTDLLVDVFYGDGKSLNHGAMSCDSSLIGQQLEAPQAGLEPCFVFPWVYSTSGNFDARLRLTNDISSAFYSAVVPVYFMVPTNLVLRFKFRFNETTQWLNPYGPDRNYLPSGVEVMLYSNAPAGALFRVCYEYGDGEKSECPTEFAPTPLTRIHVYEKDTPCGVYLEGCEIKASMNLSSPYEATESEAVFYVQHRTVNPRIVDYGPVVKETDLPVDIEYDVIGTDACVLIDWGSDFVEGPRQILRGSEYLCSLFYPITLLLTLKPISQDELNLNKIILHANYTQRGKYFIQVSIRNMVQHINWTTHPDTLRKRVLITGGPCSPAITSLQAVPFVLRSKKFEIPASIQQNCTSSFTMTYNWTMEYATSPNATVWENVTMRYISRQLRQGFFTEIPKAPINRDISLAWDKKVLPIGFYRFTLQIDYPEEELLNRTFVFITEVRRTPLVASFNPPGSYVDGVFGAKYTQIVDASTLSFDPDADESEPSNLEISYYCKRSCEGNWPSLDTFEKVVDFIDNPRSWTPKTCETSDPDLIASGVTKAGCFYGGWHSEADAVFPRAAIDMAPSINLPKFMKNILADDDDGVKRPFNVTLYSRDNNTGPVRLQTGYMFENETFNILAVVMDRKTKRFTLAVQAIRLEKGEPPKGPITQLANCGYPYKLGCLMNPTSRMTSRKIIENKIIGRLYRYRWYFVPVPHLASPTNFMETIAEAFQSSSGLSSLETLSNWTNLTSTDRNGPDLSFNAKAFGSEEFGRIYVLINEAWLAGGRIGRSMMVMYVDNPPNATVASCKIEPSSGTAMTTQFSITCSGFSDLDDPVLKKYVFVAYPCSTCDPIYLTPIPQVAPELKRVLLPSGDPSRNNTLTIRTYCYDSVDAVGYVDTSSVRVAARTDMEYIMAQFEKLSQIALGSTPDLLVAQLMGFANLLNAHQVEPFYAGNWTLLDDEKADDKDKDAERLKIAKDFDRWEKELKSLRKMRLNAVQWIKSVGISKSSINSVKSYCTVVSMLQQIPEQSVYFDFQSTILNLIVPSVGILANYSNDITIDPNDMDAACSACVNALGKLSEVLEYTAKYSIPRNPSISTTTPDTTTEEGSLTTTTQSPQMRQLTTELKDLQEDIMTMVLKRKGVQERRSVIGGSSSKMSLSADFVGNLNNAQLASGADEDCGSFRLGDAQAMFGPSVLPNLAKQGASPNDTELFKNVKIQLKAGMETGNAKSGVQKGDAKLNSMVQSLTLVDENGDEIKVKNLPFYMEIMVESRNPNPPTKLVTAAQGFASSRFMKPINLPVVKDSAVFVQVDQLYDLDGTEYALPITGRSCNVTDRKCKDPYENVTLPVGPRNMSVGDIRPTKEEVAIFVFLNREGMFPKEVIAGPYLGCMLPRQRIEDELLDIAASSGAVTTTKSPTTTTKSTTFLTTTVGPNIQTTSSNLAPTIPPSQRKAPAEDGPNIGPKQKDCKKNKKLPSNTCFFGNDVVNVSNSSATLSVGIRAIPIRALRPFLEKLYAQYQNQLTEELIVNETMSKLMNETTNVLIQYTSYAASCIFWDAAKSDWSTEGCYVGPLTTAGGNPSLTQCFCNHLTTFGSNFDVPMNTFNPADSAFAKLDENPVCFTFGICIFGIYFTLLIWARKKDREDEIRWGSLPMIDNDPRDQYAYEISVWTGQRSGAGTTARVSFVLIGDEGETEPRMLDDVERPVLQRGQVDSFIMTVPRSLGKVSQLRIWHDNSGKHPAWYFSRMMVYDLQRNAQFFFLCDQWLAVEEGDGLVERTLFVAGKRQLAGFEHLFVTRSQRKLTDGHLWVSVFSRPPRSAFTRTQRLTCCLSVLYCTMLSNIMFFGITRDPPGTTTLSLGPIGISTTKIMISVISAAIVMPVNLVIVQLFRMSRRKLSQSEQKVEKLKADITLKREAELREQIRKASQNDSIHSLQGTNEQSKKRPRKKGQDKKKKKAFKLPWWCTIVAYSLSAATCGVAFWAIVEYGGALGPDKAIEWVTAMVLSLFTDILCLQPLKIIALAMFYALIVKNPTKDEDVEEHMLLKEDEAYIRPPKLSAFERAQIEKHRQEVKAAQQEYVFLPPDPDELKLARERRLREIAMWRIIKEVSSYTIFLYMVMFVAFNNVDPWAFTLQRNVRAVFYEGTLTPGSVGFFDVDKVEATFDYINSTLFPILFDNFWYTGRPDTLKGFTREKNTYLAGILRLRQLRVPENACRTPARFRAWAMPCITEYSIVSQEDRNFTKGWGEVVEYSPYFDNPTTTTPSWNVTLNSTSWENVTNLTDSTANLKTGWSFSTAFKSGSTPSSGQLTLYDGGGYIAEMPRTLKDAQAALQDLKDHRWLDDQTRALFIEYNLYNPSRSLYAVSQNILEFPNSGGVVHHPYFYILKMQSYSTPNELMSLVVQAVTLLVIFGLFVRECNKARKMGRSYWKQFWLVLDFCHLLSCIVWAGMFAVRYFAFQLITGRFKKRHLTYTNMDLIVFYDFIIAGFAAAIVCVGTLRFIRLLRFDRSVMLMLQTLVNIQKILLSFLAVFCTLFVAFSHMGYYAFNSHLKDFSTFVTTLETCFAMSLGSMNFDGLRLNYGVVGAVFTMFYALFINILLMNFFVAFIVIAYQEAQFDKDLMQEERQVLTFMIDKALQLVGIKRRVPPSLSVDKRFMYTEALAEDEVDRFTSRMEQLMAKVDAHLEKTKKQYPGLFDERTLNRNLKKVYTTD